MPADLKQRVAARADDVHKFHDKAKTLRELVMNNPDWDRAQMLADRVTREIAQSADKDAIIVHEAGSVVLPGFEFNPDGGRELFFYYAAHLGPGVGTAAGVKLARPKRQVICLVGDGSFVFGPTALWNMARIGLPVITGGDNKHTYRGPPPPRVGEAAGGAPGLAGRFFPRPRGAP